MTDEQKRDAFAAFVREKMGAPESELPNLRGLAYYYPGIGVVSANMREIRLNMDAFDRLLDARVRNARRRKVRRSDLANFEKVA